MVQNAQLLVHAGAPSTRNDDATYIAQVNSYLAFQACRVHFRGNPPAIFDDEETSHQSGSVDLDGATRQIPIFVDDTQLAYNAVESQLATSSLLAEDHLPVERGYQIADDSSKGHSISPGYHGTNKKRRLEGPDELSMPNKHARSVFVPLPEDGQVGLAYLGDQLLPNTRGDANADNGVPAASGNYPGESTSELPTSYSLSDITSESSRTQAKHHEPQRPSTDAVSVKGASCAGDRGTTLAHLGPVDDDPASPSVRRYSVSNREAAENQQNETFAHAKNGRQAEKCCPSSSATQSPRNPQLFRSVLATLSTAAYPPEPATDQKHFTTHITDALRFLEDNPNLENKYAPVSISRDILPLERGYWLVDSSSWNLRAQLDFWQFIEKLIRRGNAGWGVWCIRNIEASDDVDSGKAGSIGLVKIFCWGEVVKHVYLMLYAASKSQVKKLGLQWIDAEQQIVVQMRKQ